MTHKQKLILTTATFFTLGVIFVLIGEIRTSNKLGSVSNTASVILAQNTNDIESQKQEYLIMSSQLGELKAFEAFTSKNDPKYQDIKLKLTQTEENMMKISDSLFGKISLSDYYDLLGDSKKEEEAGYNSAEDAFINGSPSTQVDKYVSSDPVQIVNTTQLNTKSYAPLSVIPGLTDQKTTSMKAFLRLLFKWGIAIAVILSIVMITYGGFQYMTTDAVFAKSEGRAKINAAIIGLLLALSAWLILQTVDPRILQEPQSKIIN